VLAGRASATPRRSEGASEILRQTKVAKETAVKARTQAIVTLKTLIVTAPDELRAELDGLSKAALRDRCAALRPGNVANPLAAAKHAIRGLARRWIMLQAEIKEHEQIIDQLTQDAAPAMRAAFGIGPDIAAEMLIIAGDGPTERLRSEAAFAKLCGVATCYGRTEHGRRRAHPHDDLIDLRGQGCGPSKRSIGRLRPISVVVCSH
jgi:transposase